MPHRRIEVLPPVFVHPVNRRQYVAWIDWEADRAQDGVPQFRKDACAIVDALKPRFSQVNPNKVSSWLVLPFPPIKEAPQEGYLIHSYGHFSRECLDRCIQWYEQCRDAISEQRKTLAEGTRAEMKALTESARAERRARAERTRAERTLAERRVFAESLVLAGEALAQLRPSKDSLSEANELLWLSRPAGVNSGEVIPDPSFRSRSNIMKRA